MKKTMRAFTLIELLVVIAIIAILAAILFPVFAQAKAAAKSAACLSNTKQLGLAMMQYTTDNDGVYPAGWYVGWNYTQPSGVPNGAYKWEDAIYLYAKNEGIYNCATASGLNMTYVNRDRLTSNAPTSWDDNHGSEQRFGSYGLNCAYWVQGDAWSAPSSDNNGSGVTVSETAVDDVSGTILMADGNGSFQFAWANVDEQPTKIQYNGSVPFIARLDTSGNAITREGGIIFRHAGRANVIWTDGHSKSMTPGDALRPATSGQQSNGKYPLARFTIAKDD